MDATATCEDRAELRPREHFRFELLDERIVAIEYPEHASLEAIEELFDFFDEVSARFGRVAYLIDMRPLVPSSVHRQHRAAFAERYLAHRATIEAATICEARIVRSRLVHRLVTAVEWWTGRRRYPARDFSARAPALMWVRAMVADEEP